MKQSTSSPPDRSRAGAPQVTIASSTVSLSVKYMSALFPFDAAALLRSISRQGFIPPEAVLAGGPRVGIARAQARKGELALRIEPDRMLLGVVGPEPADLLKEMDALEALLRRDFDVASADLAHYYELLATLVVGASVSPFDRWTKRFAGHPLLAAVSTVFGRPVQPFGLRLVPAGERPNQPDWFEVRIEPVAVHPDTRHYLQFVFRNSRRDVVFDFTRRLKDIVRQLVTAAEEEENAGSHSPERG